MIRSKPATKSYRSNWDRVFARSMSPEEHAHKGFEKMDELERREWMLMAAERWRYDNR